MGTKVQCKTYFQDSVMDPNNGIHNGMLYHDEKASYNPFGMSQAVDGDKGYAKEQMRQTILNQESIFKFQLQELHRLYKKQRDLMNELTRKEQRNQPVSQETSNFRLFESQVSSVLSQRKIIDLEHVQSLNTKRAFDLGDLNEPIQVEETSFSESLSNKNEFHTGELQRRDLSANSNSGFLFLSKFSQRNFTEMEGFCSTDSHGEWGRNKRQQPCFNFTDDKPNYSGIYSLGSITLDAEPRKNLEHLSFSIFDQKKAEPQRKRTIFGVDICEKNHTPSFGSSYSSNLQSDGINSESSFVLPWTKTTSSGLNASTYNHNHWLSSSNSSRQIPELFAGKNCVSLEECVPMEKHKVGKGQKNHENPERRFPPWLMANSSLCNEQVKGKETAIYQMNLDSLQNNSQQFFKKAEMTEGTDKREFKKVKVDDYHRMTKILGVPIVDVPSDSKELVTKDNPHDPIVENHSEVQDSVEENGRFNQLANLKHHIDLNICFSEDDCPPSTPFFPEAIVKIASMEIDLEAPPVLESETDSPEIRLETPPKIPLNDDSKDTHIEKVAAEAIVSISSSKLHDTCQEQPADTLLRWFADVITSPNDFDKGLVKVNEECSIPEGMDYFEYITLKLQDTKEELCNYKSTIMEEVKEEEAASLPKRTTRKSQGRKGRQRKDFQRDVMPSIVSLSRREVTEDLQTFEEAFTAIGVSWQSGLSKRRAASKNGRGRPRMVVLDISSRPPPPPLAEQSVCREVEKSLGGWGKRTRRLPRQRCSNGGNLHSFALKC